MTQYNEMFAAHDSRRDWRRGHAAGVTDILWRYHQPKTVIDMGCGMGFFLAAASARGAEIQGVDGPWVADLEREIPEKAYTLHDLEKPYKSKRRYELAASLEVAEHISPERSDGFVAELTALSDYVLFSAAIPAQKGRGHINCQWQGAWAERFAAHGYKCYDPFRRRLMAVPGMAPWFMQNLLFFVKESAFVSDLLAEHEIPPEAASYMLPKWHNQKVSRLNDRMREYRREAQQAMDALARVSDEGKEDLTQLKGIGPAMCEKLHKAGVSRIKEIAQWSASDIAWAQDAIGPVRLKTGWEGCIEQAKQISAPGAPSPLNV